MNKKEIIDLVYELSRIKDFSSSIQDDDKGKKNNRVVGTSQFRDLANLCKKAECMEEIKLFIKYKTAKGNGWDKLIGGNENNEDKKFGDWIIEYIEKIEQSEYESEREKLLGISEFFGYLFWLAKSMK